MLLKLLILPLFLASLLTVCSGKAFAIPPDSLEVAAIDTTETEALIEAYHAHQEAEEVSLALGLKLMAAVTITRDEDNYNLATEVYYWSLDADSIKAGDLAYLKRELMYMEPLLSGRQLSRWTKMATDKDPEVLGELKRFWIDHESVYSTTYNYRLTEHWLRIHHAQEHFTKNSETVYETDERGDVYVRYGRPNFISAGTLSWNSAEIRNKIYDLYQANLLNSSNDIQLIQNATLQLFTPVDYEIWIYEDIARQDRVLFIFGQSSEDGYFSQHRSIEDFIYSGNFNTTVYSTHRIAGRGLIGGYLLQFMMYNELTVVDHFFSNHLKNLEDNWRNAMQPGELNTQLLAGISSPNSARNELQKIQSYAPQTLSDADRAIASLDVEYLVATFYDSEAAVWTPFVFYKYRANPGLEESSLLAMADYANPGLRLISGTYNPHDPMYREHHPVELPSNFLLSDNEAAKYRIRSFSLAGAREEAIIYSELFLTDGEQLGRMLGRKSEPTASFSEMDASDYEYLSDVLLGEAGSPSVTFRGQDINVSYSKELMPDEDMAIYFEVIKQQGKEYNIRLAVKKRGGFLVRRWRTRHEVSFTHGGLDFIEPHLLEIQRQHHSPGSYKLVVELLDADFNKMDRKEVTYSVIQPN